ncbi:invertase [Enemella evansiae]|uniref:recombinase family protein n=1 Tax=Enemella evansiae TaxID=2016499 RepID=UPI000B96B2D7|nr:recombinase family protein [Enemella evansiae]OYO00725.1 invertase [Enemella evansiae]
MKYGYTRTSTRDKQHDDLQRRAVIERGVEEGMIFSDKISGSTATHTRPGWSDLDERLREGDELVVWRIDRIGRSLIDIVNTVHDLLSRGVGIRSISDGIDPSTREGRMQLNLMATFAEYERELIQERVQAGVDAARGRGVRFGRPPVDPVVVARKLRLIDQLVAEEGLSVAEAAATQGWSRATYYRHRGKETA